MATLTARIGDQIVTWRDKKRYFWPLSLVVPFLPFMGWGAAALTGWDVFWYAGPLWILVGVPILDTIVGVDRENPPEWATEQLSADRYYRLLTYLFVPLQYIAFFWGAWMYTHGNLSAFARIGLTLTVGAVGGIGIANAHELGHKKSKLERWLAKVVLAQTAYGHFEIEHNRGHHARVSTPEDPASARFGESFWAFFPRSVIGGIRSGWNLEKVRLARIGRGPWSWRNDVLNAWVMTIPLYALTIVLFGPGIIVFL
ncbi:MAG: alkane 1-monooxygenase, partial [Acidimicrobiales bacterium]|nr:alkane 1-monooxygenase [Acidimicrobiales bacterium]